MEPYWRAHIHKAADLIFEIQPGTSFWPSNMHEPLIVALFFPFLHSDPWQLKGTPAMLGMGRILRQVRERSESTQRDVLRKLWAFTRRLASVSPRMVLQMLQSFSPVKVPHSDTDE